MEVEYLRPGTKLPASVTISRYIKTIHIKFAPKVKEYFQTIDGAIHLAIDGWASPVAESYLGIVIIWYEKPKMHHCVLEFIQSHRAFSTMGLRTNPNLTLVQHLQKRTPHLLGLRSYVRCFVHIINLMAKAFLSPFSRPSRSTKRVLEENMAAFIRVYLGVVMTGLNRETEKTLPGG
ncbi:hypothetical protein BDV93DRAFT_590275 [Ceratobasidium sp. AG-I]|nr:hypothetical protein BDV93DRAFT_590275 [Ceratobasidium sp. AG-I]